MKKINVLTLCLTLLLLSLTNHASAQDQTLINLDTVTFHYSEDLNYAYLSVSLYSPENTNSLDFSVKIMPDNLQFDTVFIHMTNLSNAFGYYEPGDSTLRFTSFSLNNYPKHSPIVSLRFQKLNSVMAADFVQFEAYLNGSKSETILLMSSTGIGENDPETGIRIFPNPATEYVVVDCKRNSRIQIYDQLGKLQYDQKTTHTEMTQRIDLNSFHTGIYIISVSNNNSSQSRHISIIK